MLNMAAHLLFISITSSGGLQWQDSHSPIPAQQEASGQQWSEEIHLLGTQRSASRGHYYSVDYDRGDRVPREECSSKGKKVSNAV